MKHLTQLLIFGIILLFIGSTAFIQAQSPERFSYQAVIRDADDDLIRNAPVGIRIQILEESAFGNAVYVETQSVNTNSNGLVSFIIGDGNVVQGDLTNVDWANKNHFIKTEVDPTGGDNYALSGTSELLSVPYALYAASGGDPGLLEGTNAGNTTFWDGTQWVVNNSNLYHDSQRVGIGIDTPSALLHTQGLEAAGGNVVFEGEFKDQNPGPAPVEGDGTRMMWYPDKSAFRVGTAFGGQWDTENIGDYSTAWGLVTTASGRQATAWGFNSIASGLMATAWGADNEASAARATAWGSITEASGDLSTAWGNVTKASEDLSTAWGRDTEASGVLATTWGDENVASGDESTAWGKGTEASVELSTAWGLRTKASGGVSTAWGKDTEASGSRSTAWGDGAKASGFQSTSWGVDTEALGSNSTAWGDDTEASGSQSTAWGFSTEAPSYVETALGRYNTTYSPSSNRFWRASDRLFVIGNGVSSSNRNDALVLLKNGNLGIDLSDPDHRLSVAVTTKPTDEGANGDGLGIVNTGTNNFWNIHMSASWLRFSYNGSDVGSRINTNGEYIVNSDKRFKTDIATYNKVLAKVLELEVKDYRYKNSSQSQKSIGFIAQDVLPLFPELVSSDEEDDYLGINYSGFSVIAIQAIQEQQQIIEGLENTVNKQQQQAADREDRLQSLEQKVEQLEAMLMDRE